MNETDPRAAHQATMTGRFGAVEMGVMAGYAQSGNEWSEVARFAERAGFASLSVSDHVHEQLGPVAAILRAADVTDQVKVGSLVFNLDLRHPALLAKEVATIDLFCGGRFELGVGAGWDRGEYECIGLEYAPAEIRIARLREGVAVLRQLLGAGAAAFQGQHYQVNGLEGRPTPSSSSIPILIGGGGRQVLSLAAEMADVVGLNIKFTAAGVPDPTSLSAKAVASRLALVEKVAGDYGNRPAIHILAQTACATSSRNSAADTAGHRWGLSRADVLESPFFLIGTPDQIVADMLRHRTAHGITRWTVAQSDMRALAPVAERLHSAVGSA